MCLYLRKCVFIWKNVFSFEKMCFHLKNCVFMYENGFILQFRFDLDYCHPRIQHKWHNSYIFWLHLSCFGKSRLPLRWSLSLSLLNHLCSKSYVWLSWQEWGMLTIVCLFCTTALGHPASCPGVLHCFSLRFSAMHGRSASRWNECWVRNV